MITVNRLIRPLLVLSMTALFVAPGPARDLSDISRSGRLSVATRPTSTLIFSPDNQEFPGFCHELVSAFAQSLDVNLDIVTVSAFREYWRPIRTDGTPELFSEVDLYADIISVTPSRQEIVEMVPFIENTEVLVGDSAATVRDLGDLRGSRVAVVEGMSFQRVLTDALSGAGIPYVSQAAELRGGVIVSTAAGSPDGSGSDDAPQEDDSSPIEPVRLLVLPSGTRTPLMFFPDQLAQGAVDFFLIDSLSLFHQLFSSQSLRASVRPLFPVNSEVGYLSFAVSRESPALAATLRSWMSEYQEREAFTELVERYTGLSYEEYRSFVRDFPR